LSRMLVPSVLRPLVSTSIAWPLGFVKWLGVRHSLPVIRARLDKRRAVKAGETAAPGEEKSNDMLSWIIDVNAQKADPEAELDPWNIAGKIILFDLFATHTTSTTTNLILVDILTYASAASLLTELREEADAVMPKLASDPICVRDMVKMDSVIRETLRASQMVGHGLIRRVTASGGVTTPDGLYLPHGSNISASVIYPQRASCVSGDEWRPLRFYDQAASSTAAGAEREGADKDQRGSHDTAKKQTMAVQINDQFLAFGLGKHACPGRFFAVQSMKLMLGYIMTHYDIEPLVEPPKMVEIGETAIPSSKTMIKLRRRPMEKHNHEENLLG